MNKLYYRLENLKIPFLNVLALPTDNRSAVGMRKLSKYMPRKSKGRN